MNGWRQPSWAVRTEYLLALCIAIGVAYTIWFFFHYHYLPQPFFYEPSGTFMDWYSLSYYGTYRGAYDIEGTIYPPLSFVIMKIFSEGACYRNALGEPSRSCDQWGIVALSLGLVVNWVLTFIVFRKLDPRTWLPRSFAIAFGLPMLYAYERGNLVLFCYACILLCFGPLVKSARLRWFFGGIALNFKVYLIGAAVAPLLRRRWMETEGIIISGVLVYLATWAILGEGNPVQVVGNIAYYAGQFGAGRVLDLWYPSSFTPAISLLKGEYFSILTILPSRTVELLLIFCQVAVVVTQIAIVLAAAASWLRPEVVPRSRLVFFAIAFALTTTEAGGYTEILFLPFIMMERWKGVARPMAIVMAYVLCIPGEYVVDYVPPLVRWSWLGGTDVIAQYGVGLAALLRPIVVVAISWCLSAATLHDVWIDVRQQGWRSRLRLRRDAAVLPGVIAPPAAGTTDRPQSQST